MFKENAQRCCWILTIPGSSLTLSVRSSARLDRAIAPMVCPAYTYPFLYAETQEELKMVKMIHHDIYIYSRYFERA